MAVVKLNHNALLQPINMNFFVFQFKVHMTCFYPLLCDMWLLESKAELRAVLRRLYQRIGPAFGIVPETLASQNV